MEKNGFLVLTDVLNQSYCDLLLMEIKYSLEKLIISHQIAPENYFNVVNRWPLSKLISTKEYNTLLQQVKNRVEETINGSVAAFEADVIYKSIHAPAPTPWHQDISYAWKRPYLCSTWIPLTDVTAADSSLLFQPGSHHYPILPAVDFWAPDYEDPKRASAEWNHRVKQCVVNTGDGILFSSRVWHASQAHQFRNARFAIVLRWGNKQSLSISIPLPIKNEFGLWTCGDTTQQLLKKGWRYLHHEEITGANALLTKWIKYIETHFVTFIKNPMEALDALRNVQLLNHASNQYNGGDGQGIIYKTLWSTLLLPLSNHLDINTIDPGDPFNSTERTDCHR